MKIITSHTPKLDKAYIVIEIGYNIENDKIIGNVMTLSNYYESLTIAIY